MTRLIHFFFLAFFAIVPNCLEAESSPLGEIEQLLKERPAPPVVKNKSTTAVKRRKATPEPKSSFSQTKETLRKWPPKLNYHYPDLQLLDIDGNYVSLSSFRGRPLLIQPVAMHSPACQALSGGKHFGGFRGVKPQQGLQDIEDFLGKFAGIRLGLNSPMLLIQIVFFDHEKNPPTLEDIRAWRKHFPPLQFPEVHVLAASADLSIRKTRAIIPGFQLLDKNFVLRYDSTGGNPTHDLYKELIPAIRQLR